MIERLKRYVYRLLASVGLVAIPTLYDVYQSWAPTSCFDQSPPTGGDGITTFAAAIAQGLCVAFSKIGLAAQVVTWSAVVFIVVSAYVFARSRGWTARVRAGVARVVDPDESLFERYASNSELATGFLVFFGFFLMITSISAASNLGTTYGYGFFGLGLAVLLYGGWRSDV